MNQTATETAKARGFEPLARHSFPESMSKHLINDNQTLKGAKTRFGREIQIYDDGFGPLWIHRDSMGISGIVRAQTFEDAYGICEDEFFPDCDLTHEEIVNEYGHRREHLKIIRDKNGVSRACTPEDYPLDKDQFVCWETKETLDPEAWMENELFCEAYGFRPNGGGAGDKNQNRIYAKDLNGDHLEILTPALLAELEITLEISENE